MVDTYVATRFLSLSYSDDGTLILHNSRTGAIGAVAGPEAELVRSALKRSARHVGPLTGVLADLRDGGFLILEGTDERSLVHEEYVQKCRDDLLHLIILPTEECNFRCIYCYESFLRGEMSEEIREGVRRYVSSQRRLKQLEISWFGGEPLLAANVVIELSEWFSQYAMEQGIKYNAAATTNGSLLTPDIAEAIIPLGVRRFQITLDGVADEHNKRRVLKAGGSTFDSIISNLRYLKQTNYSFVVMLRHNFDPAGMEYIHEYIDMLKREFGGDPRFITSFEAIGRWGGTNDDHLSVCEGQSSVQAFIRAHQLAAEAGFRSAALFDSLGPSQISCYAAHPRSFVIGSDGRLYKCTVELDYHDRNVVGRLKPDGTMDLDWRKMALWVETNGRREGVKCNSCFFGPACHGAVCPKEWMDKNDIDCPPHKVGIRKLLPILAMQSHVQAPPEVEHTGQCTRG